MKYRYFYQTSGNESRQGWITARDRKDAYAQLRKKGIKPYMLLGKDPLAWKRWAAIGALSVLVAGLTTWILLAPRPAVATVEERAQLYGDPATIQQLAVDGWRKTFADAGDASGARHAIPAATCDCKSVVEDAKQRRSGSGCARREAIGLAERVSANPEGYPPTEGRCRRQSLEWCRKGPRHFANPRSFTQRHHSFHFVRRPA